MNLPGRYPITSADGHKYIFIMYNCDSDYIKGVAMKSRETSEMIRCYGICHDYFKAAGITAQVLRLDNGVSQQLIKRIEDDKLIGLSTSCTRGSPSQSGRMSNSELQKSYDFSIGRHRSNVSPQLMGPSLVLYRNNDQFISSIKIKPKASVYTIINGTFDYN